VSISVINKHGNINGWSDQKIYNAVNKAAERVNKRLSETELQTLRESVKSKVSSEIHVSNLHNIVSQTLIQLGYKDIAESYMAYRNYKTNFVKLLDDLYQKAHTQQLHTGIKRMLILSHLLSQQNKH